MQPHKNGQLILFSPVSGPCYYAFDGGNRWWIDPNDGHLLDEKLVREMMGDATKPGHSNRISCVRFGPGKMSLATGSLDNMVGVLAT